MTPKEKQNLILKKDQQPRVREMRAKLHAILESANANRVPFSHKRSMGQGLRAREGSERGTFPPEWIK